MNFHWLEREWQLGSNELPQLRKLTGTREQVNAYFRMDRVRLSGESRSWFILKANYSPRELEVTETMGRGVGREIPGSEGEGEGEGEIGG